MFYNLLVQQSLHFLCQQIRLFRFHGSGDHAVETRRMIRKPYPVALLWILYDPRRDYLAVASTPPNYLKGRLSVTLCFGGGNVKCLVS